MSTECTKFKWKENTTAKNEGREQSEEKRKYAITETTLTQSNLLTLLSGNEHFFAYYLVFLLILSTVLFSRGGFLY